MNKKKRNALKKHRKDRQRIKAKRKAMLQQKRSTSENPTI
jgi:hypothetical protein